MIKMLKIGCFILFYAKLLYLRNDKLFPCNFLLNSGENHVIVTSFTHIHSGLQQNVIFQIFSTWKVLKMLNISCFKQNQRFSGMPQGIPKQFFTHHC